MNIEWVGSELEDLTKYIPFRSGYKIFFKISEIFRNKNSQGNTEQAWIKSSIRLYLYILRFSQHVAEMHLGLYFDGGYKMKSEIMVFVFFLN